METLSKDIFIFLAPHST